MRRGASTPSGPVRRFGRVAPALPVAAAAAAVIVIAFGQLGDSTSAARTEREVVTAQDGIVQSTVTGSGNLEPVTEQSVDFGTSGTLASVAVTDGEYVHKGQLLATLDDADARATLAQARANLAAARTTLTDDRRTLAGSSSDAEDTDLVVGGATAETVADTLTTSTTRAPRGTPTSTTSTTTTSTTATTTAPTTTATTATATTGRPAGGQTTTVTVTAPATATTPTSTASGTRTASATKSSTPTTKSSTTTGSASDGATSTVTAATVDADRVTVLDGEQTVIADARALSQTRLRAPVSGTITSLESLAPGDSVSSGADSSTATASSSSTSQSGSSSGASSVTGATGAGSATTSSSASASSAFAEIDTLRHLAMTVSFTESDISELHVGESASVSLDALSDTQLAARVTSVSSLGTTSGDVVSYDATLTLTQRDARVKPGMSAAATVVVKQAKGVTVPSSAVTGTGNLATVSARVGDRTQTKRVIVGLRGSERDLIVSGLKAGTQLVETETLPSLGASASTSTTASGATGGRAATGGAAGAGGLAGGGFGGAAPGGGGAP